MTNPTAFLPARIDAWQALSDLFLDTTLDDADIASIARRLHQTGIAVADLERIYEDEVAPVCWRNLTAVPGGEWVGFSRDWLVARIGAHLATHRAGHRHSWLRRWRASRHTASSRADWNRLRACLENEGARAVGGEA